MWIEWFDANPWEQLRSPGQTTVLSVPPSQNAHDFALVIFQSSSPSCQAWLELQNENLRWTDRWTCEESSIFLVHRAVGKGSHASLCALPILSIHSKEHSIAIAIKALNQNHSSEHPVHDTNGQSAVKNGAQTRGETSMRALFHFLLHFHWRMSRGWDMWSLSRLHWRNRWILSQCRPAEWQIYPAGLRIVQRQTANFVLPSFFLPGLELSRRKASGHSAGAGMDCSWIPSCWPDGFHFCYLTEI